MMATDDRREITQPDLVHVQAGSVRNMGLQVIEIILALEDHFGVSISDDVAEQCITVGAMQKAIVKLLALKRNCKLDDLQSEVWQGIVKIVAEQMGIDPSVIKPESKWVGDITKYG
ncbi:MAG: hypothetical protein HY343_03070 [Lentisphaerae bacterium]|nr:hypothetical protein [Lentisphaerota bacterium]